MKKRRFTLWLCRESWEMHMLPVLEGRLVSHHLHCSVWPSAYGGRLIEMLGSETSTEQKVVHRWETWGVDSHHISI